MRILNRKANYEYSFIKEFTAGLELLGPEVKSLRKGDGNITESYIYIVNNEAFLKNSYISKYKDSRTFDHEERRDRKLLLRKKEIKEIHNLVKIDGNTIIPIEIFLTNNMFKIKIGLGKGKKLFDKRNSLKEKDLKREIDRSKSE